jgi:formylglycine-generating enzyme required for sulfatase activity
MHVYISYARIDEPYGLEIAEKLRSYHTVAYDDRLFLPHWWQTALMRLSAADVLIYLLSPEGAAAEYCRRECEVMQQAGRIVVPVLVADGAPDLLMLEGYTRIDLRSGLMPERVRILLDILSSMTPVSRQSVYETEAAKRPFEVSKDDAGTLITDANQAATEEEWEKAVYLLRSALATGFTSQLINVEELLHDAEDELLAAQYERQADRAYGELRRQAHTFVDQEEFLQQARAFAKQYPGYDPDQILAQLGINTSTSASPSASPQNLLNYWRNLSQEFRQILLGILTIALVIIWLVNAIPNRNTRSATPTPTFSQPPTRLPIITPPPSPTPLTPVDMRYIAGGCFDMGSDDGGEDERPQHRVCVDSFYMDRYEVSNKQFGAFSGYAQLASADEDDTFPRTFISWLEARNFCDVREARLPTEAEWEFAATYGGRLNYPWGDVFQAQRTNSADPNDNYDSVAAVSALSNFASPDGIVNLIGNVAEWTSSAYETYPYDASDGRESTTTPQLRVIRGGSHLTAVEDLATTSRVTFQQQTTASDVGFRCARDA